MAKSFKKPAPAAEPPKKTSEKDFLDFLEQDRQTPLKSAGVVPKGEKSPATSKRVAGSNTNNTSNTKAEPVTGVTHVTDANASVSENASEVADVRQTFIIGSQYLDQLKDYVHTRRVAGQYEYTQKQALHAALDLLFASTTIEPRPAHIRAQEETRKQRIRRGLPR